MPTDGHTARDVYRNAWAGLDDREGVADALELLVEYKWLTVSNCSTGGRPTELYTPTPSTVRKLG